MKTLIVMMLLLFVVITQAWIMMFVPSRKLVRAAFIQALATLFLSTLVIYAYYES